MASSTSSASTRVPTGTRGSTRSSRPQHLPGRWEQEPAALAHGSPSPYHVRSGAGAGGASVVYRDMERGPALAPELDNRRDAAMARAAARRGGAEEQPPKRSGGGGGLMRRMFDRRGDDHNGVGSSKPPSGTTTSKPRISAPSAPLKAEKGMVMVKPTGFAYATAPAAGASDNSGSSLKQQPRGPPPQRPTRPPVELSPETPLAAGAAKLQVPPELAALKAAAMAARSQAAKPVVVRPERLARATDQALCSHPVRAPELLQARKAYHRKTSVVAARDGGMVMEMHPETTLLEKELPALPGEEEEKDEVVSTKASRRRGMVFDTASLSSLTSFPEPVFSPEVIAADDDQQQQQSEGKVEVEVEVEVEVKAEPKAAEPESPHASVFAVEEPVLMQAAQRLPQGGVVVPAVVLTPPREPARQTVDHLTTDYPYKRQLKRERAAMREALARWEPVGEMLCGASGGAVDDPADAESLAQVLEVLADDSDRYCALRPTLDLLAHDRRVSPEDPHALAQAIVDVLNVRNEAMAAAAHHKKKARALERKLEALVGAGVGGGVGVGAGAHYHQ